MLDRPPPLIVLFNYGGGLRGLIPAQIMTRIEHDTNLRMADMVDVFAGPSTGAILNAALTVRQPDQPNRPKYKARHLVRFYEREGERIFPPDRLRELRGLLHDMNNRTMRISQLNSIFRHGHYNPSNLGRALKALYGDARLSDSLKSLIISTYNIDRGTSNRPEDATEDTQAPVHTYNNFMDTGGHALWLKNIHFPGSKGGRALTPDLSLYDAVMASTAAPTYFPCHHFQARWPGQLATHNYAGIDGSIFDNPATTYLGALRQHMLPNQKAIIIGLGTGYTNRSIPRDEWNRFGALGVVDPANDLPLINIFFHATESAMIDAFRAEIGDNLFLFNKSMVTGRHADWPSTQIDDGSPENMQRLKNFADAIIEENRTMYDQVCDLLVKNHEQRKNWMESIQPSRWKKILGYLK